MGLIETPRGVANVESIAQAGGRLRALVFGGGDYQLDLGSFQRAVGAPAADYAVLTDSDGIGTRERHWNDLWHFATARIANACRAFGVMPIDGPFSGISRCRRSARGRKTRPRARLRMQDGDPSLAN